MENQTKQFNSLEYFNDKVTDLQLYNSEYKMIKEAFEEAKKMYAEEIENAYKKEYLQGAGNFFLNRLKLNMGKL